MWVSLQDYEGRNLVLLILISVLLFLVYPQIDQGYDHTMERNTLKNIFRLSSPDKLNINQEITLAVLSINE